jgi:hypothetical protein
VIAVDCELTADAIRWDLAPAPDETSAATDLLVDVVIEAQSYRLLAQQAVHALHELQRRHDRQQASYYALLDEQRGIRPERDAA